MSSRTAWWTTFTAAILSFLGLGARPPMAEWGAMAAEGRGLIAQYPHVTTFPSLAIFAVVLAFNLLGDGLRDALDPQLED
jgi:ABC-type dipeptide/oligopeptide/nickel transport system permease subunit